MSQTFPDCSNKTFNTLGSSSSCQTLFFFFTSPVSPFLLLLHDSVIDPDNFRLLHSSANARTRDGRGLVPHQALVHETIAFGGRLKHTEELLKRRRLHKESCGKTAKVFLRRLGFTSGLRPPLVFPQTTDLVIVWRSED